MLLEQELIRQFTLMGLTEDVKRGWAYEKMTDASIVSLFKEYLNLTHMRAANNTLYSYVIRKRPHLKNIMFNMLSPLESRRRKHIPWDGNYGKTFKIFYTPKEMVMAKMGPMASIITPDSPTAWSTWEELKFQDLFSWMENWDEVQKYLPDEKYEELIRAMDKYR